MDPNVCYQETCDAIEEVDRLLEFARERAISLCDWLKKGGCNPLGVVEPELRIAINRVIDRSREANYE